MIATLGRSWFRAARSLRADRGDPRRRALALAALAWVPLAVISVVERLSGGEVELVLRDPAVHARLLIGIPVFVLADLVLEQQSSNALRRLADQQLADPGKLTRYAGGAARWKHSMVADLVLLGLALTAGQVHFWVLPPATGPFAGERLSEVAYSPGILWYAWVALPIFVFVANRFLYRWLIWGVLLARISRLPLATEPIHADQCAGLYFLALPTQALAAAAFATSATVAAACGREIALGRAHATQFGPLFGMLAGVFAVLALAPLLAFAGPLRRCRQRGMLDYGQLALTYSRRFRARWIDHEPGPELLGTSDIQSLNDLLGSYASIRKMRPFPYGRRELIALAVALLAPILPLMLTEVPLMQVLVKLARKTLGA